MRVYTPAEIRKILLENCYCSTAAQVCAKWQITPYRLRQWKQQWNYAYLAGNTRELVIVALHQGASDVPAIIRYLDYVDHAMYSTDKVLALLQQLQIDGIALNDGTRWLYSAAHSQHDRSFMF
jgi:hypothetical protein